VSDPSAGEPPATEAEGRRTVLLVLAVFGTIALIFGSIAGGVLVLGEGQNDAVAIMGGGAWLTATMIAAIVLAVRAEAPRGTLRRRAFEESGVWIDPDARAAGAGLSEGVEWEGRTSLALDAPGPIRVLAASGLTLPVAAATLYALGRITPIGLVIDFGLAGFLVYMAWLARADRDKRDRADAGPGRVD